MRAFDVNYWYRGSHGKIFTANHHIATLRPLLRMFAPEIKLLDKMTTLDESNLTVQAHIAVLLKFLVLFDNFDMNTLYDAEGHCGINMDEVLLRLRNRYAKQLVDINTFIVPEFENVLYKKAKRTSELVLKFHDVFEDKEGDQPVDL